MSSVIYFPMYVGLTTNIEIFTINPADGSNLRQLTSDTNAYAWCTVSRDGSLILAGSDSTSPSKVWILRTDGSIVGELTNRVMALTVGDWQGDWSPDGSQVVLTSTQYGASGHDVDLQIVNVDNSGYTPVVLSEKMTLYANSSIYWSPDGTKFLFPSMSGDFGSPTYSHTNVVSCNIDGSGSRRLLDAEADLTHPLGYLPWGWYSDSTHVAAAARTDSTNQSVVKTDGTATTTLFSDNTFTYLNIDTSCGAISPDNTAIAWNSPHDNAIVVLRDGVAHNYAVPYTTSDQGISWTPGGGHALTWSATGLPAGVTIDASTGVISGSPTDATADYPSVIVTATDTVSGCTASTTFDWLITIIVTIDAVTNQIVTTPHAVNLPMIGHDSAGDALTWSATGLPSSLSINASTGVITGTLVDADASTTPYNTVVTATDSVHTAFSASASFAWLVSSPAPVVTSVTASSGSAGGGETVTIIGQHFTSDSTVRFGTVAGTAVTYISSTQLTAVSPAEPVGTVDVTVSTPYGTSATSTADHYTYVIPITGTIAFCIQIGTGNQQIYALTSAARTQLTTGTTNWNWCRWSKDGNFLLAADTSGNAWILNADGSPVRQLTNLAANANIGFYQGDWSPDGSQVVLLGAISGSGGSSKADLQIVNVDNSGHTAITLTEKLALYANSIMSWSPDGTKFLYTSMLGDFGTAGYGQLNTVACNIDGSGSHRILDATGALYDMRYIPWGWYSDSQNVLVAQQEDAAVRADGRNRLLKSDGTTTVVLYEERQQVFLDPVSCLGALCPADEASIAWNSFSVTSVIIRTAAGVIHGFPQGGSMSTDGLTWKA